jgi:molybdenum cofactor biosynthesis enzyme MoaA
MDCTVNHSLFLRSNGSLACWCDGGSLKTLQEFDPSIDYAEDVYLGKVYGYIRDKLAADTMPFPEFCKKCMVLLPSSPFVSTYASDRYIDTFQIEPSMACQLDCPSCIPIKERRKLVVRSWCGHLMLAPKVVEKILKDFKRAGMRIRLFDFTGHGEPLLNPDAWSIIAMAKSMFPDTAATICTNANADFTDDMVDAGLTQMIYAIDGMDQASYEPYRVYGKFDQAYRFMKSFSSVARAHGDKIDTVWKYVLFSHNDRPEQLLAAQEMAIDAQVTELRFIITQMGPTSTRIVDEDDIPRANNGVKVQVQNYKVSIDQLDEGMAAARTNLDANRPAQAAQAASFVATMMKRLFEDAQSVPPKYGRFLHALTDVASELPEPSRSTVIRDVEHLSSFLRTSA